MAARSIGSCRRRGGRRSRSPAWSATSSSSSSNSRRIGCATKCNGSCARCWTYEAFQPHETRSMTAVTFIFDDHAKPYWRHGQPPRTALSHDYNLFQMAHEGLRLGMTVHFTTIDDYYNYGPALPVSQVYPLLHITDAPIKLDALD